MIDLSKIVSPLLCQLQNCYKLLIIDVIIVFGCDAVWCVEVDLSVGYKQVIMFEITSVCKTTSTGSKNIWFEWVEMPWNCCPGEYPFKCPIMTSLSPVYYHCSFSLFVSQLVVGQFNMSGFRCCSTRGEVLIYLYRKKLTEKVCKCSKHLYFL